MTQVNMGTETCDGVNEKCTSDPNFAVICAFLAEFGQHPSIVGQQACGKDDKRLPDIGQLQNLIEKSEESVDDELIKFHVKLLRKLKKSVAVDKWEKALIKFAHTYSSSDAWELERFGYRRVSLQLKCRILKNLIESQFDHNEKFKKDINSKTASELRKDPLGRDRLGNAYWYQVDEEANLRVYKEDPDEETWELVASTEAELLNLIEQLRKGDTFISPEKDISDDMDAIPLEEEDSMQCDITNIIRDTGRADSSGLPSRAESAMTTPANCHSDNEDLDEMISAKNSLNPSRESSVPPDEKKRFVLAKPKNGVPEDTKLMNKAKQNSESDMKSYNSENNLKTPEDGTGDKFKSSDHANPSENSCDSILKIDLGNVMAKTEILNESSANESNVVDAQIPRNSRLEGTSIKVENNAAKSNKLLDSSIPIQNSSDTGESNLIRPLLEVDKSSEKLKSNVMNVEKIKTESLTPNEKSQCPKSDKKRNDDTTKLQSCADDKKQSIIVEEKSESKSFSTNSSSKKETIDNHKVSKGDKDISPQIRKWGNPLSSTSDLDVGNRNEKSSPGIIAPEKPENFEKPNTSIKHPIASMLSDSVSHKDSNTSEANGKATPPKPKHSIESMLSSTFKPTSEKNNQPHRSTVDQLNMVTPFIPVISSNSSEHHTRPFASKDITTNKIPNLDPVPYLKRTMAEKGGESTDNSECNFEKKPRLNGDDKTKMSFDRCLPENADISTPVLEPIKVVKGNGSGAENTTGNHFFGEVSEPVFLIVGRGLGKECNVGNPRRENGRHKTVNGVSAAKKEPKGIQKDSEEDDIGSEDEDEEKSEGHDMSKNNKSRGRGRPRGRGRGRGAQNSFGKKKAKQRKRSDSSDKDVSGESDGSDENDIDEDPKDNDTTKTTNSGSSKTRGRPPGSTNKKTDSVPVIANGTSGSLKDFHQPKSNEKNGEEDVDADTQELVSRLSRRSSGRIAMQRIRDTERRQREEEEALKSFKTTKEGKKKRKKESDDSSDDETVKEDRKRKRKKKKKPEDLRGQEHLKQFSKFSSGSESGEEDEDGEEIEEEVAADGGDRDDLFKSDHEFSCESDVSDDDFVPVKHARTATKKKTKKKATEITASSEEEDDEFACKKCSTADHPEWILLCDKCDDGWHASCLRPPLMVIPEGTWYCPQCSHTSLIERLEENLKEFQVVYKKKEAEIKRKERLAYVTMSLSNVVSERPRRKAPSNRKYKDYDSGGEESSDEGMDTSVPKRKRKAPANRRYKEYHSAAEQSEGESSSSSSSSSSSEEEPKIPIVKQRRAAKNVSYNTNEYDEMIKSALEQEEHYANEGTYDDGGKNIGVLYEEEEEEKEEDEDAIEFERKHKSGQGQGKDMSNILNASDSEEDEKDPAADVPKPVTMTIDKTGGNTKSNQKKKKLTGLDASDDNDGDSGSDFTLSESNSESEFDQDGGASTEEELEYEYGRKGKSKSKAEGGRRKSTRNRRVLYDDMDDFVVSGSDDSDESYTRRKKKSKGRSKTYKDDSWDSDVTSDEGHGKKKSSKKTKSVKRTSNNKPKSKPKLKRYSEDSDVEFDEYTGVNEKNILDEDDAPLQKSRKTRGKKTKYNLILDDSSESEHEKAKGPGKQIENCVDSTEEEYDAKDEDDDEDISEEDPDDYIEDDDSKEKSEENDASDINNQVQIANNARTLSHNF